MRECSGCPVGAKAETGIPGFGFLICVAPISIWLIFIAPNYESSLLFSIDIIWLGYVALGLMATLMTGNLMRHLWLGGDYRQLDAVIPFLGVIILISGLLNESNHALSSLEQWLLLGTVVISALRVAHQGLSSYREISKAPQR